MSDPNRQSDWNRQRRAKTLLTVIRLLCVIAFGFSAYLAYVSSNVSGISGCGGGWEIVDCDDVLKSRWSSWVGIPVSFFGAATYAGIFILTWTLNSDRLFRVAFRGLVILAALSAMWFIGLQLVVIQKLCLYCLAVHTCGLILLALMIAFTYANRKRRIHSLRWVRVPATLAFGGLVLLVGGQFLFKPAEFEIVDPGGPVTQLDNQPVETTSDSTETTSGADPTSSDSSSDDSTDASSEAPKDIASSDTAAEATSPDTPNVDPPVNTEPKTVEKVTPVEPEKPKRKVSIWRNAITLDIDEYPSVGDPETPEVIVKMFDYACPDCRRLHRQLKTFKSIHGRPIVVLLAPAPMNTDCNPFVRRTTEKHINSCEYSKLAFAVWETAPSRFESFHDWMMKGETPPSVAEAITYAKQQLEIENIEEVANSAAIRNELTKVSQFYQRCNSGIVPKLFVREKLVVGAPTVDSQMITALQQILSR